MKIIAGKRALVTGAASGIGRAIATRLAAEGAELCLLDVDGPALEALATQLRAAGTSVLAWRCDLSDLDWLDTRLTALLQRWGKVDILVNNAGRAYLGYTVFMSDKQWDTLVAVNLLAPARIIRRLLPGMSAACAGHIVNIASVAGLVGFKRVSGYCLTKFGLVGFSESLRAEVARYGVGVSVVCPAFVRTGLFDAAMNPQQRQGVRGPRSILCLDPEAVADSVIQAIRKNKPLVVPGASAKLLWLCKRAAPRMLSRMLTGFHRPKPMELPAAIATGNSSQTRTAA